MAVLDAKKTYRNLKSKGFTDSLNKSGDHKYIEFFYEGKLLLYTKISHGASDLGDYLIKQMAEQCKLDKKDFMDLANCPLSMEEYIQRLVAKGLIIKEEKKVNGAVKEKAKTTQKRVNK